jgi:hypothetical protein
MAGDGPATVGLFTDGTPIAAGTGAQFVERRAPRHERAGSFKSLVCALAYGGDGLAAARYIEVQYD